MKKTAIIACSGILLALVISTAYRIYSSSVIPGEFNCRGRVYVNDSVHSDRCVRHSAFNVFFTMKKDGNGFALFDGTTICDDSAGMLTKNDTVNYTYKKENGIYSLQFNKRDENLSLLARELANDELKIILTPLNNNNYLVSTPQETMMICTRQK